MHALSKKIGVAVASHRRMSVTSLDPRMGPHGSRLRSQGLHFSVPSRLWGPRLRCARAWLFMAMHESFYDVETHRNDENRDHAGRQHSSHHCDTKEDSAMRSG